ncbi:primosomal replication protein [Ferrimonas marina]|uniref:Restart primosome assembly protein PriC n=1 Tax=Ferrimonas marina TaxID=299255 RepID=A0A1M5RPL0_9GAMM|nr:primosomal replication protein [Ferrimonas marina]SHH28149.1 restart primosome assembly protein PriC [Ferrimonas marina]
MRAHQLEQLKAQLAALEAKVHQHDAQLSDADKRWLHHKSRFHEQLFEQQGASLAGCLEVLRRDLKQIEQMVQVGATGDTLGLACQRFGERFEALMQALANTDTARRGNQLSARGRSSKNSDYQWIDQSVMNSSHKLHQELAKHKSWEDKMVQKIQQMEQALDITPANDKITLQNEILALHKRLGKCRQAMTYIEQRIAWLEKPRY